MTPSLLLVALLAQAAPAPPADGAASEAVDALIEQAARQYDQNQLAEALDTLEKAYALEPRPAIVFNMAQVHRLKGDCAAARDAYARFLTETTPDDSNRERAERRKVEMQACLDSQAATAAPKTQPPVAASQSPTLRNPAPQAPAAGARAPDFPVPPPAPIHRWRPRARAAAWVLAGLGTVAAGTAAFLAWRAADNATQFESHISENGGRFDPTARKLYSDGNRDAHWARWLGVGAAVAGGGAITLFVFTRHSTDTAAAGAQRHVTAGVVGWSMDF